MFASGRDWERARTEVGVTNSAKSCCCSAQKEGVWSTPLVAWKRHSSTEEGTKSVSHGLWGVSSRSSWTEPKWSCQALLIRMLAPVPPRSAGLRANQLRPLLFNLNYKLMRVAIRTYWPQKVLKLKDLESYMQENFQNSEAPRKCCFLLQTLQGAKQLYHKLKPKNYGPFSSV